MNQRNNEHVMPRSTMASNMVLSMMDTSLASAAVFLAVYLVSDNLMGALGALVLLNARSVARSMWLVLTALAWASLAMVMWHPEGCVQMHSAIDRSGWRAFCEEARDWLQMGFDLVGGYLQGPGREL